MRISTVFFYQKCSTSCRTFQNPLLMSTLEVKTEQFITVAKAKKLIGKFKKEKDKIVKDEFKGKHLLPDSETFDRSAFEALLKIKECKSLRVYFGMEDDDKVSLVVVAVDENGNDILTPIALNDANMATMESETEVSLTDPIVENGVKCPPTCPIESPLNS